MPIYVPQAKTAKERKQLQIQHLERLRQQRQQKVCQSPICPSTFASVLALVQAETALEKVEQNARVV